MVCGRIAVSPALHGSQALGHGIELLGHRPGEGLPERRGAAHQRLDAAREAVAPRQSRASQRNVSIITQPSSGAHPNGDYPKAHSKAH